MADETLYARRQAQINRAPKQAGRLLIPAGAQTTVGTAQPAVTAPPPAPAAPAPAVRIDAPVTLQQQFRSQQKGFSVGPGFYYIIAGTRVDRRYLLIQNNGAGSMYVAFGVAPFETDGTGAIAIAAGGYLEYLFAIPTDQVLIMGSTAGGDKGTLLEGVPA